MARGKHEPKIRAERAAPRSDPPNENFSSGEGVFHLVNPSLRNEKWAREVIDKDHSTALWSFVSKEHPHHTEMIVHQALKEEVKRLVVWGGDGTLHRVVRSLWQKNALDRLELALVPVGTCNDLARCFGINKDMWKNWEKPAPEAQLVSLSLARLSLRYSDRNRSFSSQDIFINNAGFGRPRSSYINKDPAWKVLQAFSPLRLTAKWGDGRLQGLYYMVLACHAPYFSGGLHFEKSISPAEETLRVYFVPARSKSRLAAQLLRGQLGYPLFDSKTTKVTAEKITMDVETPVWPQCDGEPPPEEGVRHMEFDIVPQKFKLWKPA